MLFWLFLAFTLIPVAELYILIKIGSVVGSLNTILLIILTGLAGAHLAREQGMHTMMKVRQSLNQGIMPAEELTDALIILVAGIVLLTPGLITDVAGLLLLFPPTRSRVKRFVKEQFNRNIQSGHINIRRY